MLSYFINYAINLNTNGIGERSWRIPFAMQCIPGLVLLVGLLFQNESPRWLVEKKRIEEARAALSRVRSLDANCRDVSDELDEIVNDFHGREKLSLLQQLRAFGDSKATLYRCTMAIILMFWQQWTGSNGINYYSPQIFASIGLTGRSQGLFATGIYGVVKVVVTGLGLAIATEQVGRKWSLIIGGLGQAFAMFYIGGYSAVHPVHASTNGNAQPLTSGGTFAIVCIYLFVVFFSFGWGPIPWVLSAECSPNHVRSLVMALAVMMQWLCNFSIAKLTPIMLAKISYGTFLLFGSTGLLMALYAVFFVPETKRVPLESIHLLFEGEKSIVVAAMRDTIPRKARAKALQNHHNVRHDKSEILEKDLDVKASKSSQHRENV
jgi:MFS transporter, SP family, sugar:H+ symporter